MREIPKKGLYRLIIRSSEAAPSSEPAILMQPGDLETKINNIRQNYAKNHIPDSQQYLILGGLVKIIETPLHISLEANSRPDLFLLTDLLNLPYSQDLVQQPNKKT